MSKLDEDTISNSAAGISSVVPQLFYDVIARLVPGVFLACLFLVIVAGPHRALSLTKSILSANLGTATALCTMVAASMFCYALSVILWQQYVIVKRLLRRGMAADTFNTIERRRSFKYDYIKHKDPIAGNRITKLSAEIHMTEVFFVGFFYAAALTGLISVSSGLSQALIAVPVDLDRTWLLVASFIGLLGSYLSREYFCSRCELAVRNCYEIHEGPEQLRDETMMYTEDVPRVDIRP